MENTEILKKAQSKAQQWLKGDYDTKTKKEVRKLIEETDTSKLVDAFFKDLEFGTGGMRGIMGVGTNRVNKYTLGAATQGLSNYLYQQFGDKKIKVAIAYDCRNNSRKFAEIVANVLSANDIQVYLFEKLRPTPELSFAVRFLHCQAGIVLTASHNPPEYNGYKVYWYDGSQVVPPHDIAIIEEVRRIQIQDILFEPKKKLIRIIGKEIDNIFVDACVNHGSFTDMGKEQLKIVFTSIHGSAIMCIPQALERAGFKNTYIVKEQATPDGNFPTVKSPNPEESAALKMALDFAEEKQADIVIGTDPDADRLGIAVRNLEGEMVLLNGNQANTILIKYLLDRYKENGTLTSKHFIGSTIVSSDIFFNIAKKYNVVCKTVLTGFKWIAKTIRENENEYAFVGGGEESFGFMVGDFVRDKDSITSTLLAAEIAAVAKANGSSLFKELLKIYKEVGLYRERLISLVKKGIEGTSQIKQMMVNFRKNPPKTLAGSKVIRINDYQLSVSKDLLTGDEQKIELPTSNVLIFYTEDGTKLAVRPSGTEPKIKFYFSVNTPMAEIEKYRQYKVQLEKKIDKITAELGI